MAKSKDLTEAQKNSLELLIDLKSKLNETSKLSLVTLAREHGIKRSTYAKAILDLGIVNQINDNKVRPEYEWGMEGDPSMKEVENIQKKEKEIISQYTQNRKEAKKSEGLGIPKRVRASVVSKKDKLDIRSNPEIPDSLRSTLSKMEIQLDNLAAFQRSQTLRQQKEDDWQEALYTLKLHEKLDVQPLSMEVIRVIGGWIYINKVAGARTQMIFVKDPQSL